MKTGHDNAEIPQFEVLALRRNPQSASIALHGELDLGSAPILLDCLAELASSGVINFDFDLANLTFLDSSGISILVTDFKRSSASGGSFVVRNTPPQAMRVFEITGLVDLLSVTPLEESSDGGTP
jgi:anti-sigma B factor antagonist